MPSNEGQPKQELHDSNSMFIVGAFNGGRGGVSIHCILWEKFVTGFANGEEYSRCCESPKSRGRGRGSLVDFSADTRTFWLRRFFLGAIQRIASSGEKKLVTSAFFCTPIV